MKTIKRIFNPEEDPFKLMQRLLAFAVSFVYLGVWILAAALYLMSFYEGDLQGVAESLATNNHKLLSVPFGAVTGLYIAGGAVEGIFRAKSNNQG